MWYDPWTKLVLGGEKKSMYMFHEDKKSICNNFHEKNSMQQV
jgi:hypothetical protein